MSESRNDSESRYETRGQVNNTRYNNLDDIDSLIEKLEREMPTIQSNNPRINQALEQRRQKIEELKKTVKNITEEECQRAIVKLKSNILMSRESNSSRAQKNASNILSKDRIISTEELIGKIEAVNTKKLQNLMEDILKKSKPTIALLGKIDNSVLDYDRIVNEINKG